MTKPPTADDILTAIGEATGLTPNDILEDDRTQPRFKARAMFVYIAVRHMGMSISESGRQLGRDHTTCIHARRRAVEMMATDPHFRQRCEWAMRSLGVAVEQEAA